MNRILTICWGALYLITPVWNFFVPSEEWKEALIDSLKTEVMEKETLSLHDAVLASLLKETKNLKPYFSKHEAGIIKEKLKTAGENPDSGVVKEMIGYLIRLKYGTSRIHCSLKTLSTSEPGKMAILCSAK